MIRTPEGADYRYVAGDDNWVPAAGNTSGATTIDGTIALTGTVGVSATSTLPVSVTGTVNVGVNPLSGAQTTSTSMILTATAATIPASATTPRSLMIITNVAATSSGILYLGGNGVTVGGGGTPLEQGERIELDLSPGARLFGIAAAATTITILEIN